MTTDAADPNRIRYWRDRAGLTQQQLGDRIGITRNQVYMLETGRNGLTEPRAIAIAAELGCRHWQLYAGSEVADAAVAGEAVSPEEVYTVVLAIASWAQDSRRHLSPEDIAALARAMCRHIDDFRGRSPQEIVGDLKRHQALST